MFERFTDRARRIIVLAQKEAISMGHKEIGTGHILAGVLAESEGETKGVGPAARALDALGVKVEEVRSALEERIEPTKGTLPEHLPFTARAKYVLEMAMREMFSRGDGYIGTEHILLGMTRILPECTGAEILVACGCDLEAVRQRIYQVLADDLAAEAAARAASSA